MSLNEPDWAMNFWIQSSRHSITSEKTLRHIPLFTEALSVPFYLASPSLSSIESWIQKWL
ncbi:MAG: hypothetical protein ACI9W6_003232 [Motiliproteus sp.]|jgi:hypothetical protein